MSDEETAVVEWLKFKGLRPTPAAGLTGVIKQMHEIGRWVLGELDRKAAPLHEPPEVY